MNPETRERFGGIERLYGTSALDRFLAAHVCVVGIGGVGSWIAEALARSGIGRLTLVDLDDICLTNINRQIHALDSTIGRSKTTTMAQRIREIHPECNVAVVESFYTESNAEAILAKGFDCVIDAIDSLSPKAHLLATCHSRNIPIICCGGAGGRRDPSQIHVDDLARSRNDPLLSVVRKRMRLKYDYPRNIKKKFGITTVYSSEFPVYPQADGTVCEEKEPTSGETKIRLNCNYGFGSSTVVTATFAMHATAQTLRFLEQQ